MESNSGISLTESGKNLVNRLLDTRKRELELISDLSPEQLLGSKNRVVEPPIWELGHVGWFQDRWILQNIDKFPPADDQANSLYDSFNIPNDDRWNLMFPSLGQTTEYITDILHRIIDRLEGRDPTEEEIYFYTLALNHEEMHSETMHHIRHTFGYSAPKLSVERVPPDIDDNFELGDIFIGGGAFQLGANKKQGFVFDNEKWVHPIDVKPFEISNTPVTFSQYLAFVEDDGYQNKELWEDEGLEWLERSGQRHPIFWQKDENGQWQWRWFQEWLLLSPFLPMINVNWYEAKAYCKWADRRLPAEAEWEYAASMSENELNEEKGIYPWGNSHPESAQEI